MVTDFLAQDRKTVRGRPVGVAFDWTGVLIVADDVGDAVWRSFRNIELGMSSAQVSHLIKRPMQNFCKQSNEMSSITNNDGKFDFRIDTSGHITIKYLLYNPKKNIRYDKLFKQLALKYDCHTNKIIKAEYTGEVLGFVPLSSIRQRNSNLEEKQDKKGIELYLMPREKKTFVI